MTPKYLTAILLAGTLSFAQGRELSVFSDLPDEDSSFNLTSTYNTRYWNEGRDFLENDDLWATSLNYAWEDFTVGFWYGKSTEVTYEELQLGLAWHRELADDLDFYVGYAYIDYMDLGTAVSGSEGSDSEFSFGLSYTGCPWGIVSDLDVYYSDDAEGFFAEVSVSREWELTEKWDFNLAGVVGMNQGYIEDGSDGLNHMALIVGFDYEIREDLTFTLEGVRSFGLDRTDPGDMDTDDFLHGRASLTWTF